MIRRTLARLTHMDAAEIAWRGTAAARIAVDRARTRIVEPKWSRRQLLPALARTEELEAVRSALADHRWNEAQIALARHFAAAPQRFVIAPRSKAALIDRIQREFPNAACHAAARADRILAGEYDLLAYRGLRFDRVDLSALPGPPAQPAPAALPDWHTDPVNRRSAPRVFWSTVPYLSPECGDHKVIWELNRHQHWLTLGRAFWLTGDRRYRERVVAELASWLDANPPLTGINWASMLELAFRSISWLWAIQFFAAEDSDDATPWLVDLLTALDRQLTHVEHNLSHYFSPNTHLLGEALALYVTGRALPELAASARRVSTGRRILLQEIDRQIAADGGHCERSTHYHRYTLDFYALALICARHTGDRETIPRFEDAVTRLGAAARLLTDDDGRIPHFGDDDAGALTPMTGRDPDDLRDSLTVAAALVARPDFEIGAAPEEALWLLGPSAIDRRQSAVSHQSPAIPSRALPDTGYYVSRTTGSHLVIDGGPHGYQNGGHAHADALSLTLTVRGMPLLIDPGTGFYTTDAGVRDRMRSSALHNTVTIDDRSQSLPNGPFHWSQRANTSVHRWHTGSGWDYFDGSHDGYDPVEHRRRVLALHRDLVIVADFLGGDGAHAAAVHWHLDPRWTVDARARGAIFTCRDDRVGLTVARGIVDQITADAESGLGWWSPAYGRIERTTTMRIRQAGSAPFWMVSVFDLNPGNPVSDVDWVPVWAEAGVLDHASAVRITRASSVDHVLFAEPGGHTGPPPQPRGAGAGLPNSVSAAPQHNVGAGLRAGVAGHAGSHPQPISWRVGDVETDARMLFLRSIVGHPIACLASIDATTARTKNLELLNPEPLVKVAQCAALPVS